MKNGEDPEKAKTYRKGRTQRESQIRSDRLAAKSASMRTRVTFFSRFRIGLVSVNASRGRWLVPIDMMWVRAGDRKSLPFTKQEISGWRTESSASLAQPRSSDRWECMRAV
jgi:hypothetical protein